MGLIKLIKGWFKKPVPKPVENHEIDFIESLTPTLPAKPVPTPTPLPKRKPTVKTETKPVTKKKPTKKTAEKPTRFVKGRTGGKKK